MNLKNPFDFNNKVTDNLSFATLIVTSDGSIVEANEKNSELLGYAPQELKQQSIFDTLLSTVSYDAVINLFNGKQANYAKKMNITTKNDLIISTTVLIQTGLYNGQNAVMLIILPEDFYYYDDNRQNLLDIRKGIESTFMTITIDEEGFITSCNSLFLKISNWTPKRVLGKTLWHLFPDSEAGRKNAQIIWSTLNRKEVWQGEVEKLTRDGLSYWVHLTAIPIYNKEQTEKQFFFMERDITKDKTIQLQLEKIAFIDTETGLMNIHRLELNINDMIREKKHFSFVYISIDKFHTFKDIKNDLSGTNLIIEFTKRLKAYFQDSKIARINEHEFVVITQLPEWFIQGFLDYLIQYPIYDSSNVTVSLSISGSITRSPEDQSTFTQLMKASIATIMNLRKAGGNNIGLLSRTIKKT